MQASRLLTETSATASPEKPRSAGTKVVTDIDQAAFRRSADRFDERPVAISGKEALGRARRLLVA